MCFGVETLDRYVMERLREPDRTVVELHVAHCRHCHEIVDETKAMIAIVLLAAAQPEPDINALIVAGPARAAFASQAR
jgi:hypothetical protein